MTTANPGLPTRAVMQELLERAIPGRSASIKRVREQVLDIASSLTARSILLRGPIGAGKSTLARLIGLLKRASPVTVPEAERILGAVRFEGPNLVDVRYLPWYVEVALTGLVETLAEVQLFGAVRGAYTGATEQRAGVFEQAMNGRMRRGQEPPAAAKLTGGVVFLDEIGDLTPALQAKLLPVLSGGLFYRIGGEGNTDHELQFKGVTIAASWKDLPSLLRPDLLSRVAAYVIDVPGIDDRREDFDVLFEEVQRSVIGTIRRAIEEAVRVEPLVDRPYWRARLDAIQPVSPEARRQLAEVDWARHGNLRGLSGALEQIISNGAPVERVVAELPLLVSGAPAQHAGLLARLFERRPDGQGLAGHIRVLEVEQRRELRDRLMGDERVLRAVGQHLAIPERQLLNQVHQLDRRRQRSRTGRQE